MAAPKPVDHRHTGRYDRPVCQEQFRAQFAKCSRYNAAAMPDMLVLLTQIEQHTDTAAIAVKFEAILRKASQPAAVVALLP